MEPPPNTTIRHTAAAPEESCTAPLQRASAPLSPGRAKALSPTARLSSMAVQSLEGVHLPFTKGTPPSAGGGSHNHLPSPSSFKNLTVIVQQQEPLAEEMPPISHLFRRLEALEEENQRLRRLVEQLTVQQEQELELEQQQHSPPKPRLLHAPASSPPRLAKTKASSVLGSASSQQQQPPTGKATSVKGGGSSSKRYPLGISRFSWPPGSPSSTVGRSLADLDQAAQQDEKSAASTPRSSSSLSRTPMGKCAATSSTLTRCMPSTTKACGSGSGGSSNSNTTTAHRSPSTGAAAGQQQQQQPPLHFTEFAMCGVKRAVLRGEEPPQRSVQQVEALEVVMMEGAGCGGSGGGNSSTSSDEERGAGGSGPHVVPTPPSSSAALEKITEFCFPQGGRLELAPASQLELSTGKHRDSTHILLFTDEFGATSYGVCVTIWEPHPECPPSVVAALRRLQREDAAARAIQLFWREALLARPAPLARAHSASVSSEADALDASAEVGWVRRGLFTRMMRRRLQGGGGIEAGAIAGGGWRTPPPPGVTAPPASSALSTSSPWTPASSPAPPPPRLARADSSALEEYQRHVRAADGDHAPTPRYGSLVGGNSSRLSSLREVAEGEGEEVVVVVAPRCFCLMSDQPNHGSLMKLLLVIVDREREQADWGGGARRLMMGNKALSALKRRHSCNALASSPPTSSPGFLLAAAARPVVTGAGGLSGGAGAGTGCGDLSVLRRRFLDHVQRELLNIGSGSGSSCSSSSSSSVSISYPAYSPAPTRIDLPLVALEDWTCAVLFSRVSADVVVKIVNLLLLEQSLVIVGEDLGLVSAIATALISLLAPFRWDNPFVPALPAGLSEELLQAPVPYIVGTAATPEFDPTRATPHAAVLHLGRCREHLRLPDVTLPLPHAYQLLQEVHDAARVFAGRRSRCWANLHLATYMSGLTPDETRALAGVKAVFRRYVENLCGDIKYPQAWRKYGFLNAESGHFIFEPAWFLEPLEVTLQFQSALVRTQMLAHYIETRRAEDREEEQRLARCRRFLGHWLAFRMRQRSKQTKKALQEREEGEKDAVDESGPGFMLI